MKYLSKPILLEAGIAVTILALILYLVLPHFLANQRFGLVQESETFVLTGQWEWESINIVKSSNSSNFRMLIHPVLFDGEITCQFQVEGPIYSFGLIFDAQDPNNTYKCWKFGLMHERLVTYIYRSEQELQYTYQSVQLNPAQWNDLRLVLNQKGGTMEGFLNGEKIIECSDHQTVIGGSVGIDTSMTVVRFRNIKVSSLRSSDYPLCDCKP